MRGYAPFTATRGSRRSTCRRRGDVRVRIPANGWHPRPYQRPAWDYLERGGKHAELVWHRRSGKDELALHWTAVSAHERIGNYWHCLPQANQARKALWEAINPSSGKRRIEEAFPSAIRASVNDHEMLIRMRVGSSWQVVGSDNFDSLVGSPPVGIVLSEWPLCDPAAWAYLSPILAQNGGWAIFNGTPRGRNHAYQSYNASRKEPGHFAQVLNAQQTDVFTPEQLEAEKRNYIGIYGEEYGLSVFEQEYLCSFEAANLGAILGRALVRAEVDGRIDALRGAYDPDGAPVEISSDIGRRDASSWWFWQPCVGGFRIVDHDRDSGLDADEWCERLHKRISERDYKLGRVWLPHDARAKTFSAKHSAVEIFISKFGEQKVSIVADARISDRINAARRVIQRCAFHPDYTEKGRDGLAAWAYVYDEERKEFSKEPDHNWASHDGDGFSYGCLVMEEREPVKEPVVVPIRGIMVGPANDVTLDEMWATVPRSSARY